LAREEHVVEAHGDEDDGGAGDDDRGERQGPQRVDRNGMPVAQEVVPVENGGGAENQEHERREERPPVDYRAQGAGPPAQGPRDDGGEHEDDGPGERPRKEQTQGERQQLAVEPKGRVEVEGQDAQAGGPDRGRQGRARQHPAHHRLEA
jgi:hypothetical protein